MLRLRNSVLVVPQSLSTFATFCGVVGLCGLEAVAAASQRQTTALIERLTRIKGVKLAFDGYRFHEAVLQLNAKVSDVLDALAERNIVGGLDLSKHYPELGNALLVCATETRTDADLDAYASALAEVLTAMERKS